MLICVVAVLVSTFTSCTPNNPLNHYDVADTLLFLQPVSTEVNIWAPREYVHPKDEIIVQNSYYTFVLSIGRHDVPHWGC